MVWHSSNYKGYTRHPWMDLTSKNMYDTFKDEIWKELGPLDPDWFDVLTVNANEASFSDQDDLCANQEGNFKTPFDKTAADSQLFSTPRVFRHSQVVSPETEDDQSFTIGQENDTLPWRATQSPSLFRMSKEEVPDAKFAGIQPQSQHSIDLLHTPPKSPVSYAKHVSESLGAQIHPDISWTSSLNTPPAVPSTLILSKTDGSPCPVSVSADKSVVFVRKLFPSLSNTSRVEAVSPKNNDLSLHQGVVSAKDGQMPHESPQSSLNPSEAVWKQKLPDAIEDREIRSTVATVLDGAESVLSMFFTNSSSALRKVKTERNKRKQIMTIEHGYSSTDMSTRNHATLSEQKSEDHEPMKCSSPSLVKTGIIVNTQWSPLSLSEIPPCTVDTSCHDKNPATQVENQQLQRDISCSQLVRLPLIITNSGLTKKKRTFIYTVETSKTQAQGQGIQSHIMDSSPRIPGFGHTVSGKQLGGVHDEEDCCSTGKNKMQKQENGTEEIIPPSVQAKVQDLDMSQLCRDFAEDLTQMSDQKLIKIAEDPPQNGSSPSACLSAMKRAKQEAKQTTHHLGCDSSNRKCFSAPEKKSFIKDDSVSDSGFHSAVATTSLVLPSSDITRESQSGLETDADRKQCFLPTNKLNGNNLCRATKESQMLDPGRISESHKETTSPLPSSVKGPVNKNCILLNGQVNSSLPAKTTVPLPSIQASGFKTASNKGIGISSASLVKAKHLFEENEAQRPFSDQPTTDSQDTHAAVQNPTSKSSQLQFSSEKYEDVCQLTASQKADVTELCTLLEEADSQFEFTQVQATKLNHQYQDNVTFSQQADKELYSDFLTGIDFDDSFNSDAEKPLDITAVPNKMTSASDDIMSNYENPKFQNISIGIPLSNVVQNEKFSFEGMSGSLNHISEASNGVISTEPKNFHTNTHCEVSKQENIGFKTAGGNILSISIKCLNKAKTLFADLDVDFKDETSQVKQSSGFDAKIEQEQIAGIFENDATKSLKKNKMDTSSSQIGFFMSGGNGTFSGKAFPEVNNLESKISITEGHKMSFKSLLQNSNCKKNLQKFKNVQWNKDNLSQESIRGFQPINAGPAADFVQHDVEIHCHGLKNTLDLTNAASSHENVSLSVKALSSSSYITSKSICSSAITELSSGDGFCTASGKKVSVSADAVKKAVCLLNEIQSLGETNEQLKSNGSALKTNHLANQTSKTGELQTSACIIPSASTSLLNKRKAVEDTTTVTQTHSKMPFLGAPQRNSGFFAASGKSVALSTEALQKAKIVSFSDDIPAVSHKRNINNEQDDPGKLHKIHCGFMTAGGEAVHVSQKNLLKAKNLLKEFEDSSVSAIHEIHTVDSNNGMPVKCEKGVALSDITRSGHDKNELPKCKPDQRVAVKTSADFGTGCIDFEIMDVEPDVNHKNVLHLDEEFNNGVFSSLNTTPRSPITSAFTEFSSGFSTASGKKVSVSDDAMTKAVSLFIESAAFDEKNKKQKHNVDMMPPLNIGFQTASGKGVAVSSVALQKARVLLSECKRVNDEKDSKPTHSKMVVTGPQPMSRVAPSPEVLQKAESPISDISFTAEIPVVPVSDTRNNDKKQDVRKPDKIHCGFMTAGGTTVHVSEKHLIKARNLLNEFEDGSDSTIQESDSFFKDCDTMDNNHAMSSNYDKEEAPVNGSGSEKKDLSKFKLHQNVVLNTSSLYTTSKSPGYSFFNELISDAGFCTASRNKMSVLDDAMTEANSLSNESVAFENTNKNVKYIEDTLPLQNGGFQTASGKGVVVSSVALQKAKTLLSECEGINSKSDCKKPVADPSPRNESSNQPDISCMAQIAALSEARREIYEDDQTGAGKTLGFTTAGGAKVHVLQRSLLKAKNLLKEFAEGDCHDSNSYSTTPPITHKLDLAKIKHVSKTSNSSPTTDNNISVKECVPQVFESLPSLQETVHEKEILQNSSAHGCIYAKDETLAKCKERRITTSGADNPWTTPEEMASALDGDINQTNNSEGSKVKGAQESSFLILQSLNLTDCTETQQQFLAQEALDCTKALLEDESQAGQSLSMTLENVPLQDNPTVNNRSADEQKRKGKRLVDEPPLKRRLLETFDRTVDGPRGSTLCSEKTSSKAIMNDRKVFKYSSSFHPNITRPHRNGTHYVETTLQKFPTQHSTPVNTRSAHSRMPVFVPPFHKNAKKETHKNSVVKDNIRKPIFIPPFKKQQTVVKESSSKTQEENQHHQPFLVPSTCNSYAPVTNRTQSSADLPGNKNKDGLQLTLAASDDTTDDNLTNDRKLVGCESENAKPPYVENTSRSQVMFQNLENMALARDMQDMRIRKKRRQTIRPLPGSLFLIKTSGVSRISLKAAVNGKPPARYTQKQLYGYGVHHHVSKITSETAESFRFSLQQFLKQDAFIDCGGVQLADGGWLITSNDCTAGKEEFYRALCDTPGVDPKLISKEWVYNHYRWIVWKQASMERSFPERMASLCLTPEQVLLQLKYRYDVEVDHSRRPALRKIMERDDTAAKTLVLCVCGVVSRGQSPNKESHNDTETPQVAGGKVENLSSVVYLTDGWYAIKAQLDEPLTAMLHKGQLFVGGKMLIHGAQLVGSQDACSPLEAPESLTLKICANSSRPARWDTKLGFLRDPRPFLLPVSSLYSNGGPVGCVDILIQRSYPMQWMERKPDGGVVFRSVRAEEKEARRYNSHKQKAMEILFAKIQAQYENEERGNNKPQRRRRTLSRQEIAKLQDEEELYEAFGDDLAFFEAHLSEHQLETLQAYKRSLMEKKQVELQDRYHRALEAEDNEGSCPKRDVTPVWKLCITDSVEQPSSVYQLNLWRPSLDLQSLLKEGCRYKVFNLTTSDGKKRSGFETVQLTGTKKTQFQELQGSPEWLSERFQMRVSTNFLDLQNPEFQPLCGEVDLTGCVISMIDEQGSSPAFYLADGKLNFVKVRCFSSFAQFGLEDVVKPRVLLALSNLQLRGQSTCSTPVVYAGDLTVVSTNPKENHLQESLTQLRDVVQGHDNFFLVAEEKLSHLVQSGGLSSISSPAMKPQTAACISDRQQDSKTHQPVRNLGFVTPVSKDPPPPTSSTEKENPRSLKRRRALDYLSRIPSPPAFSYLGTVSSPCVNKTFNPPRRSGASSTLKSVQTSVCKPVGSSVEEEWVNDEELAMIDTQALHVGDVNI